MEYLLGDSRKIFANHFIEKADVYFHSGFYPTIFDRSTKQEGSHMEEESSHEHDEHCEHGEEGHEEETSFLGKPRDIIERFGRNFYATSHTHLQARQQREMLPWLKLGARLDPHKVQTYTVAAYFLRKELNKVEEAESFLREGLRQNPDSYEILFELGKIRKEHDNDRDAARNLWELALNKWRKQQAADKQPDPFVLRQILANLGALEESAGNVKEAIRYFEILNAIEPTPLITKRIEELRQTANRR